MSNIVDPDMTFPSGAVWSKSALFAFTVSRFYIVFCPFRNMFSVAFLLKMTGGGRGSYLQSDQPSHFSFAEPIWKGFFV